MSDGHPYDPLHDLELMINSRYGGLHIDTSEEERAEALAQYAAADLQMTLFVWRPASGLRRVDLANGIYGTQDVRGAFQHILERHAPALYIFHGLSEDISKPLVADWIRLVTERLSGRAGALILTGSDLVVPESLRSSVGLLHLPALGKDDYAKALDRVVGGLSSRRRFSVSLTPQERDRLLGSLQGLTLVEAEKVLTKAIMEDGRLDARDIEEISKAKRDLVERDGLLEYCVADRSQCEMAGLDNLKKWLEKRRMFVQDPRGAEEFGLDFPRGVLLVGVPGCGKSLCAKMVAAVWGLPLVRLDPGVLYNKYVGETERNLRRVLKAADRFAPMVLWVDEIEKGFASGEGSMDGGGSRRVLGSFLSWLQERQGEVFIVATANDVQQVPPELLRKGRFDEIFFVDLPDEAARATILDIHLRKRHRDPADFDVALLARESEGYSGADLEQVVVSALYAAFSQDVPLSTELLLDELRKTPPISATAWEKIEFVRDWSKGRTVPAS